MKKHYVVAIDAEYVRDAQILTKSDELEEISQESEHWIDFKRPMIIAHDIVAKNPVQAISLIAQSEDIEPEFLFAIELSNGGVGIEKN